MYRLISTNMHRHISISLFSVSCIVHALRDPLSSGRARKRRSPVDLPYANVIAAAVHWISKRFKSVPRFRHYLKKLCQRKLKISKEDCFFKGNTALISFLYTFGHLQTTFVSKVFRFESTVTKHKIRS